MDRYESVAYRCSQLVTNQYSTSFSAAIRLLAPHIRVPIYQIYGFVRVADEIVDSFTNIDQLALFNQFEIELWNAIELRASGNPVLHSFQRCVHEYNIPSHLIHSFMNSMRMDLNQNEYDEKSLDEYIYGSAEVVGLMCLVVFCQGDLVEYQRLEPFARRLGSAFQKVNFLRDLKEDYCDKGRQYFTGLTTCSITEEQKKILIDEIRDDFNIAYKGIIQLDEQARLGVLCAYIYYNALLEKLAMLPAQVLSEKRVRISNIRKIILLLPVWIKFKLNFAYAK